MWSQLFRMNEYTRHNKYLPNAAPPSNDPQLNSLIWEEIAPDEMEAVLNDLSTNPINREDSVRTYTIQRSTNGVVHVQAGLANNENWKMFPAPERHSTEWERKAERVSGSKLSGHDIFELLFRPILRSFLEHFPLHITNISLMTLTTS